MNNSIKYGLGLMTAYVLGYGSSTMLLSRTEERKPVTEHSPVAYEVLDSKLRVKDKYLKMGYTREGIEGVLRKVRQAQEAFK